MERALVILTGGQRFRPMNLASYVPDSLPEPLNRQLPPKYVHKRVWWRVWRLTKVMDITLRRLEEDYELPLPGGVGTIRIPEGYEWDFGSVPKCLWDRGFAPFELSPLATLLHDLLCDYEGELPEDWWIEGEARSFNSHEAADMFLALMERQGINGRRYVAAKMVRKYGPKFGFPEEERPKRPPQAPGPTGSELFAILVENGGKLFARP